MNLVDLSEVLTDEARQNAYKGQVYGFKQEDGSIHYYKVIRMNKAKKTVWAERQKLYTIEEAKEQGKF